jgi:hypothetical protein
VGLLFFGLISVFYKFAGALELVGFRFECAFLSFISGGSDTFLKWFVFFRTYAVDPQTVVGAGFFRDFPLVAQSLDQPALTGFFIFKCVSPVFPILAKALPEDKTFIIYRAYSTNRELAVLATKFMIDTQFTLTGFSFRERMLLETGFPTLWVKMYDLLHGNG